MCNHSVNSGLLKSGRSCCSRALSFECVGRVVRLQLHTTSHDSVADTFWITQCVGRWAFSPFRVAAPSPISVEPWQFTWRPRASSSYGRSIFLPEWSWAVKDWILYLYGTARMAWHVVGIRWMLAAGVIIYSLATAALYGRLGYVSALPRGFEA